MSVTDKLLTAKEVDLFSELTDEEKMRADLQASIAIHVHRRRIALGLTQAEFAKALNVSQTAVSKWESGDCNFTLAALAKIFSKIGGGLFFDFDVKSELSSFKKVEQRSTAWKSTTAGDNRWSKRSVAIEPFTT